MVRQKGIQNQTGEERGNKGEGEEWEGHGKGREKNWEG